MAKKNMSPVVEEVITPVEEPAVEISKYLVVTADRLNVRKGPSKETEILAVVSKDDKLLINSDKLIKGFHSVITSEGVKGYVMKEFVVEE